MLSIFCPRSCPPSPLPQRKRCHVEHVLCEGGPGVPCLWCGVWARAHPIAYVDAGINAARGRAGARCRWGMECANC